MEHVNEETLQLFIIGGLQGEALAHFSAHVSACDACARKLRHEAMAEAKLQKLVPALAMSTAKKRDLRGVAALAAGIALALALFGSSPEPSLPPGRAALDCHDGPKQNVCIAAAQRHGRTVRYPLFLPPSLGEWFLNTKGVEQ